MYIIAIGWMYVVTLMAATENSIAAGVATFLFYGAFPCAVLMYILNTKNRRLKREALERESQISAEADEPALPSDQPDGPGDSPAGVKTSSNP